MDIIHSSFQASFDARIERLDDKEVQELKIIFYFYDTDHDGAIESHQACRIFRMLGLDVNEKQVMELGDVYTSEFLKIVDSHVPSKLPQTPATPATPTTPLVPSTPSTPSTSDQTASATNPVELDEAAIQKRNETLWNDEWKLLDTYRRGYITMEELRLFLKNCALEFEFPHDHLVRFMELYVDPTFPSLPTTLSTEPTETLTEQTTVLTKASFIKFRREYTARDVAQADEASQPDDEQNMDENQSGAPATEQEHDQLTDREDRTLHRRESRRQSAMPSAMATPHPELDAVHEIVVDPHALDQSEEEESENDEDDEDPDSQREPMEPTDPIALAAQTGEDG